jgi:Arc/MetJ-type ribon-helix-helix transcriptional regulator
MTRKEKKFVTISIPAPLFKQIEERIKDTEFTSVSSYVTYALSQIVSEGEDEEEPFSKEEEERITEKLRALRYLD